MYRKVALAVLAALVVAACSETPLGAPSQPSFDFLLRDGDIVQGRHIVVFQDDLDEVRVHAEEMVAAHNGALTHLWEDALRGFAADLSDDAVAELRNDPRVKYIEPDRARRITDTQLNPANWGLDRIDQMNLPLDASYTYNNDGTGVTFYGIDTGILFSHVDFEGRAIPGADYITPSTGSEDCNGHGTHTASTAAGETYGVAKGPTVVSVRVLDCFGFGFTSGVIDGIDWVAADHDAGVPAVANMSLGGGFSQSENDAVTAAIADGVVFSISAGNSNADACGVSPASTPDAITVGATSDTDARASFSNFGTCVDIFAPGVDITAAYVGSNTATATISGTSMSAPHVAGAAILYLGANPGATPAQVADALIDNATAGVVGSPGTGSPNLMLYTGFIGGGVEPGPADPATSIIDAAPSSIVADGASTSSVTVTLFDADGVPLNGGGDVVDLSTDLGTLSSVTDNGNGTYSATLTAGATTGTATVTGTLNGTGMVSTATVEFTEEPAVNQPPVADFVLTCDESLLCTFDGTLSSDPDGAIVEWEWLRPNGSVWSTEETFQQQFGTTGSGDVTLTVTDDGGLSDAVTKFIIVEPTVDPPGPADPGTSIIDASPSSIVADGASTADVTVTLFDADGTPITSGGDMVELATDLGTLGGVTDNGDGTYSATLTSGTTAGTATVTGTLNGASMVSTATVELTAVPVADPATSIIDASPSSIVADGASTADVTVTLFDADGTPITSGGDVVELATDLGTLGGVTDNGDGTYSATLTSGTTTGTATVTGTLNGASMVSTATVEFTDVPVTNSPPVAAFTYTCTETLLCTFDGTSSSDPDGSIVAYEWLRPNGSVWSTEAVFSQQFGLSTTGTLTLTVTDDDGATNTIVSTITIAPTP